MTWTLFGISFCYVVFVGPIFACSMFNILGDWNLICFILYWFQVIYIILECFIICLFFKYTLNFVIYAARCEQYRKAYSSYIRNKFPWIFGIFKSRQCNTIVIINPGVDPSIRKTVSNPQPFQNQENNNEKIDVKLEYSLDLEYEKIIHSYTGSLKVGTIFQKKGIDSKSFSLG